MTESHSIKTRHVVLFTVISSLLVSFVGTALAMGLFGKTFAAGQEGVSAIMQNMKFVPSRTPGASVANDPVRSEEAVVAVVDKASPAVVSVVASKDVPVIERYYVDPFGNDHLFRQFFGENPNLRVPQLRQNGTRSEEVSAGSGFIVSADGMIVTNKHVVADTSATYTVLMNDGRKLPAKVLARDPVQDLAILQISGSNHPFLTLGDSGSIKIGQTAIAIGNALGEFRNTVSVGVISGLQRSVVAQSDLGSEQLQELVQTDAAINPGNSGGPLLNLQGHVVAINTAVAQGAENIGFAIPVNKVKRDVENVRTHGRIIYPYLGVRYGMVNADLVTRFKLGRDYGAYLSKDANSPAIVPGGPAEKAGLKEGDIILMFGGDRVDAVRPLAELIQKHQVGETISIHVFREGKEFDVRAKLEERK